MPQKLLQIIFADPMKDGAGAAVGLNGQHQLDLLIERIAAETFLRRLRNSQSVELRVFFVISNHDITVVIALVFLQG